MAEWYDLWEISKDILFGTLPIVAALNDTAAALIAFLEPLISAVVATFYLLFYPLICVIEIVQYGLMGVINPIIEFINVLITLVNDSGYLVNLFVGVFPATWTTLLIIIMVVNLGLRVYNLVHGISIAGFSI